MDRNGFKHLTAEASAVELDGDGAALARLDSAGPFARGGAAAGRLDIGDFQDLAASVGKGISVLYGLAGFYFPEIIDGRGERDSWAGCAGCGLCQVGCEAQEK